MSEKLDNFYNELRSKHLISLYYNRVMFYNDGFTEIQFWTLSEDSDYLILENKGVSIYFDKWEFSDKCLYIYKNDTIIGCFKLPSDRKIMFNHNHFYVEEFTVNMSEKLDNNITEKGDWANCTYDQVIDLLKKNVGNLDVQKDIKGSCIDIANYAMMAYYLG